MTVAALLLGWLAVPEPPEPPTVTVEKYAYAAPIDKEYVRYTLRVGDTREVFFDRAPFGSLDAWESSHGFGEPWRWWLGAWYDFRDPMPEKAFVTFNNVRAVVAGEVDIQAMECHRLEVVSNDDRHDQFGDTPHGGGITRVTHQGLTWVGASTSSLNSQAIVELPREFKATADSPKLLTSLAARPTAYVARKPTYDEEDYILVDMCDACGNRVSFQDSAPFGEPDNVTVQPHGKSWQHALSYRDSQDGAAPWQQITDDMRSMYRKLFSAATEQIVGKIQPPPTEDELWKCLENGLRWTIDLEEYSIEPLDLDESYRDLDAAPQVVSLSGWPETLFEGDPFPTNIRISRWNSPLHKELTVFLNLSGSAKPDVDYKSPSNWFTIPTREGSVDVAIHPLRDSLAEDAESIVVELASNDDYEATPEGSRVRLLLADGENPITLSVHLGEMTVDENRMPWAEVIVRRSGPLKYDIRLGLSAELGGNSLWSSWGRVSGGETTWSHKFRLYRADRILGRPDTIIVKLLDGNYTIAPDAAKVTIPLYGRGVSGSEPSAPRSTRMPGANSTAPPAAPSRSQKPARSP
jgi:hypothetical protein